MRVTRIGGPTVLVEWEGWRILTDPTFDPPGRTYSFALGTSSTKTVGPSAMQEDLGRIDVVLLSHHHHADNLDDLGRAGLVQAATVLTTRAGAKATVHPDVRGLRAGERTLLEASDRPSLSVVATPCRHGPPFTRPIVGPAVGFALTTEGHGRPGLWMTGDTVASRRLVRSVRGMRPEVMLAHLGAVKFPLTGPLAYTMNAEQGARVIAAADPDVVVPVHVEGWSHFSQQEEAARGVLAATPVADRIRWAPLGEPITVP